MLPTTALSRKGGRSMTPRFVRPAIVLLVLALLGDAVQPQARADLIDFSYSWTIQPAVIAGGTGAVTLSASPDGTGTYDTTSTTSTAVHGALITTTSSATSPPDTFDTPFNVTLHLTDTASGV